MLPRHNSSGQRWCKWWPGNRDNGRSTQYRNDLADHRLERLVTGLNPFRVTQQNGNVAGLQTNGKEEAGGIVRHERSECTSLEAHPIGRDGAWSQHHEERRASLQFLLNNGRKRVAGLEIR